MPTLKLQAFIAQQGIVSRRKAEELIVQGKVMVNDQPAHIGQRIDPDHDQVSVNGKQIHKKKQQNYFLVYKPAGLISTTSDELGRPTVLSLVPETSARLYPVGRLDKDSEGLMLLTTDGELTHMLTHPRHRIKKTYEVLVAGQPTLKALDHLRSGVKLKEGFTQPAEVKVIEQQTQATWLEITITQGRNRQVRRMLERVGYETLRLIRTRLGPFTLQMLAGQQRQQLTSAEIDRLMVTLEAQK